ncbi:MAG: hypothetical protein AAF485_29930 [Chloroflexota bacterium]
MTEFVKVGTTADIAPGKPLVHDFDYDTVVIFQVGDEYFWGNLKNESPQRW